MSLYTYIIKGSSASVGSAGQPSSSGSGVANGTLDNSISKVGAYSVGKDIDEKTYEWDSSYYNWIEIISD